MEENHEMSPWVMLIFAGVVILILTVWAILSTRRLRLVPESGSQGLVEMIVESLDNFVVGIVGPKGSKYTSFIGTMFIYILALNLIGLVPPFKPPTSNLSITLSLAIVVFLTYNVIGIIEAGPKKYFMHLVGEPIWLAPLMLPIHIIGELARPLSLSIRLFGNMFAEEMILLALGTISIVFIKYWVAIPYGLPIMIFDVFVSFVQALVFSMLSTVYIALAVAAGEHGEH